VHFAIVLTNRKTLPATREAGLVQIADALIELPIIATRLFHGLDLLFRQRRQQLSLCAVVSDAMSCDSQRQCLVRMLMDDHFASGHRAAPPDRFDLHDQVLKSHRVIAVDSTFESLREDQIQVPVPAGQKRRTPLRCRNRKAAIEFGDVVIVEKMVSLLQSSDPAQS